MASLPPLPFWAVRATVATTAWPPWREGAHFPFDSLAIYIPIPSVIFGWK